MDGRMWEGYRVLGDEDLFEEQESLVAILVWSC